MLNEVHICLMQSEVYKNDVLLEHDGSLQHTCREQTTQTRYKLLSLPVGVLVPVALARAPINSLLAAEEGVAGRDNTFALLEAVASLELGRWTFVVEFHHHFSTE